MPSYSPELIQIMRAAHLGYFLRNGPPAMDFQSGMILPERFSTVSQRKMPSTQELSPNLGDGKDQAAVRRRR